MLHLDRSLIVDIRASLIKVDYTFWQVAAAAARIEGKPDIFAAAGSGDLALVRNHLAGHASAVGLQNEA
jgi:hypothetical protein